MAGEQLDTIDDRVLSGLRRWPDVEAPNLHAVDASDRLILDEAAAAIAESGPGEVVVIGDAYGALTIGAAAIGATGIRVFQDSIVGERALAANAAGAVDYVSLPLGADLVRGARVVLMQLPRSLAELDELAAWIASAADPAVRVYAGGRIKHMTTAMNEVLARHLGRVDVTHARQKSRVLIASQPLPSEPPMIAREFHTDLGIWVCATGATFAGTRIDIGTRALLAVLPTVAPDATTAADLGCGSGVVAAVLAQARPELAVLASDVSAGAVASARATAEANRLTNVTVTRDDALGGQPDASLDLVVLNPPFHLGATVHTGAASKLFAAAARVLKQGGELVTVYNSHLGYRAELTRVVGPTDELSRTSKFTVTRSRKN
ncbi:MAG: methyltransferase [Actinobacteria bacterium]|nr:methyltransferase [Actinomycetota bacterium]